MVSLVYLPCVIAQSYSRNHAHHSATKFSQVLSFSKNGDTALCLAVPEASVAQLYLEVCQFCSKTS